MRGLSGTKRESLILKGFLRYTPQHEFYENRTSNPLKSLVIPAGFEPATHGVEIRYSIEPRALGRGASNLVRGGKYFWGLGNVSGPLKYSPSIDIAGENPPCHAGARGFEPPAFPTLNRSRSNSTDFPRLDLRGSRVVPRDSGILKSENSHKSSVYVLPKSCGQLLGQIWPRNRSGSHSPSVTDYQASIDGGPLALDPRTSSSATDTRHWPAAGQIQPALIGALSPRRH